MAQRNDRWFSREGFTADVLGQLIKRTLLSPSLTLPLWLLARYTTKGKDLAESRPGSLKILKTLVSLGLIRWVNGWLNRRASNNGVSDKYNWTKEIVLITGGSDGIGGKTARLLAARGLQVVVLDVQPLKYEPPSNIHFYSCNICSRDAIAEVAKQVRATIGEPTILINNAGVLKGKTILGGTDAETRQTFEVNTLSHYWLAREFLPSIVSQNHGMVVTIASQAAYLVAPNMVDYSASKAAALAFHEGLSAELVSRYNAPKVRTVLVTQSFVKTHLVDVLSPTDSWFSPLLEADTIAEMVVGQVLRGESGHVMVPGSTGFFAGNIRSFPGWWHRNLQARCERLMRSPTE